MPPSRSRGPLFVWAAVLIFAAANSVVRRLTELGAENLVDGRNAITFCNVLFVGNVAALLCLLAYYRKQWTRAALAALRPRDWLSLVALAVFSGALAPGLTFTALDQTSVTNVVLVGRIEPPLLLVLSVLFLGEKVDRWTVLGSALSLFGVGLIVWLDRAPGEGFMLGRGELYAASGAAVLALSTVIAKVALQRIPLGIFTVFRTGLGALVFFVFGSYLYGVEHFQDVTAPYLWQWMLVYGAVIAAGGQLCWFAGIKRARAADVCLASSFTPIAGVLFAALLLGERPGSAQWIGGAVVVAGIVLAQVPLWRARDKSAAAPEKVAAVGEGETGFGGV